MYVEVLAPGASFKGLVRYQLDPGRGETARVLASNVPGERPEDLARQMAQVAAQNQRVAKPVLHVIASWHPDDQVSDQGMIETADSLLEAMGVDQTNHQFLVVRHEDKRTHHFHIALNRVGFDGSVFLNQFSGQKARDRASLLDLQHGWTRAVPIADRTPDEGSGTADPETLAAIYNQPRNLTKMAERTRQRTARDRIHGLIREGVDAGAASFSELDVFLRERGVAPRWSFNSKGDFNGASFGIADPDRPEQMLSMPDGTELVFPGSKVGWRKAKLLDAMRGQAGAPSSSRPRPGSAGLDGDARQLLRRSKGQRAYQIGGLMPLKLWRRGGPLQRLLQVFDARRQRRFDPLWRDHSQRMRF